MFLNRDISWLSFNERVFQQASKPDVPLMERMRFLAIFSSNLDEFFRVRFPAITALSSLSSKFRKQTIPPTDKYLAEQVKKIIESQLKMFGEILTRQLLPALNEKGIVIYYNQPLCIEHKYDVKEIFLTRVLSFIQPIYVNKDFTENFIPVNDQPYFIATIKDDKSGTLKQAVVNIPVEHINRFFTLPNKEGKKYFIFLDDIIRENIDYLFPGYVVSAVSSFKISRDAELLLDEVLDKDIIREIEKKIEKRKIGKPTRLLLEKEMPVNVQLYLKSIFKIKDEQVFEGGRYHNLKDFFRLPEVDASFYYPPAMPFRYLQHEKYNGLFDLIEEKDRLLHFPYHNFNTVLAFFNHAAIDPDVKSIYVTLYRVASDSFIANALMSAAHNGKKVVVFVELKARFDEENNIKWSKKMSDAGILIINNIHDIKVHTKIALVQKAKTAYAIIGTGNFNEKTAGLYSDHLLLTNNEDITRDLKSLFICLQSRDCKSDLKQLQPKRILISQVNMLDVLEKEIKKQMAKAKLGEPALIRMKMNNLEDTDFVKLLYKASKAGVIIRLNVRGICCLMPGEEGYSENITVKRIVDRYLEHSRIFIFGEGEQMKTYIGSADLMTRNLYHRIEVAVPVSENELQVKLEKYFDMQWHEDGEANGNYEKGCQHKVYEYLKQNLS
jgi:polyphosphate kinase